MSIFAFGRYEVDEARREVRRAGEQVPFHATPLRLLLYLLRHRDRTVPKAEILDRVWPGVAVSDTVLSAALKGVRRALGDDGREQRFVQTLRGQGYRIAVPVAERAAGATRLDATPDFVGQEAVLGQLIGALDAARGGARARRAPLRRRRHREDPHGRGACARAAGPRRPGVPPRGVRMEAVRPPNGSSSACCAASPRRAAPRCPGPWRGSHPTRALTDPQRGDLPVNLERRAPACSTPRRASCVGPQRRAGWSRSSTTSSGPTRPRSGCSRYAAPDAGRTSSEKKCGTVADLAAAFPGRCKVTGATANATALGTCARERVLCRGCCSVGAMDALALPCDDLDDGEVDDSCG